MKFHVSAMVLVAPMLLAQGQSIVVMSVAYSWQSGMLSLTFQKKAKTQDYKMNNTTAKISAVFIWLTNRPTGLTDWLTDWQARTTFMV